MDNQLFKFDVAKEDPLRQILKAELTLDGYLLKLEINHKMGYTDIRVLYGDNPKEVLFVYTTSTLTFPCIYYRIDEKFEELTSTLDNAYLATCLFSQRKSQIRQIPIPEEIVNTLYRLIVNCIQGKTITIYTESNPESLALK